MKSTMTRQLRSLKNPRIKKKRLASSSRINPLKK